MMVKVKNFVEKIRILQKKAREEQMNYDWGIPFPRRKLHDH